MRFLLSLAFAFSLFLVTLPARAADDMWKIVAGNFSLAHDASLPEVQRQIRWFQANPKYFLKIANQGQPYIYYIYQEVKKRGLPGELVLLPMIESAYDPFAYSWVGAAGLWQMMPGTGSNFGLKQDWWYDGRKDVISSTSAALDYLTYLETFFNGNWPLAIAAYNSGEGTVQNAVNRNARAGLNTSFWSLHLPAETESYVPRLLALAAIVADPEKYGIYLPPITAGPYFKVVSLKTQIDLAEAAKMAGVSLGTLYTLNPGYSRWATDPKGPYRLLLPLDAVARFEAAYHPNGLGSTEVASRATTNAVLVDTPHQPKTLVHVEEAVVKSPNTTTQTTTAAQAVSTSVATSTKTTTTSKTALSKKPSAIAAAPAKPQATASPPPSAKTVTTTTNTKPQDLGGIKTHIVKKGETLWHIATAEGVSVAELKQWNHLHNNQVAVGQVLKIYSK